MGYRRVLVAAAAVAALEAGRQDVDGQGRGVPAELAFFSGRSGNNEIYVMSGDGSDPLRLTDDPASDVDPAVSPDGREVVFTSNRSGNNDIHLAGSTGGFTENLTNHPANDGWARWSPNGRQIVFHSNRDGNFEIYLMDAIEGQPARRLTEYPGIDQFPDWSPDGRSIIFRRDTDIYTMDLRTEEVRRLTNAPPLNQMAAWSPDGRQIAFMSARDGYPSVFLMQADGSNPSNLTPKDDADADADWVSRAPSWSRNGRHIFFMSSRPSTGLDTELFVVNIDGTGLTRITHSIGVDGSPRGR
ncbi:MAG TPA: DPP IV N-terminal domain-containing protein [Vicinamibacterales bacterium]|nr:DPP IV N-terminal domain-containing protein [Vicinamibacterales bacterium]